MTRSLFSFKHLVLAGSLAGLSAAALAQTPPAPPASTEAPARHAREHAGKDHAKHADRKAEHRAEHRAARQARLKQSLNLTPAQEPAWNVFTASMLPPGPRADRPDREALRKMTTPQRIEHMRQQQAARTAEMERRAEATLRLYTALSAEQQQVFDQRMAAGPRHGERHGPHHRGMQPKPEHKG